MWAKTKKGGRVTESKEGASIIDRLLRYHTMGRYRVSATPTPLPNLDIQKWQNCPLLYHNTHVCQERLAVPIWGGPPVAIQSTRVKPL